MKVFIGPNEYDLDVGKLQSDLKDDELDLHLISKHGEMVTDFTQFYQGYKHRTYREVWQMCDYHLPFAPLWAGYTWKHVRTVELEQDDG